MLRIVRCFRAYNHWMAPATPTPHDDAIAAVIDRSVPDLVAIYRFGSSIDGAGPRHSDIDVAVLAAHAIDPRRRFELQEELAAAIGRDVDLVDLLVVSPVMAMQVIGRGRLLVDRAPDVRGRFEDLSFGLYARLNEERRGILERVAAEGSVFGR